MRRKAFRDVGGFDTEYWNGNEDVDLCLKLEQAGWRLVYRPESVVVHHESQSGPERFVKNDRNTALLSVRWRDRITPDYYRDIDGNATPAPDFRLRQYAAPRLAFNTSLKPARKPRASVIVLCHGALDYTRRCAEALLEHTDRRHEIIFVDNASPDGTAEWLRELTAREKRCSAIYSEQNLGFAAGNNLGIGARGRRPPGAAEQRRRGDRRLAGPPAGGGRARPGRHRRPDHQQHHRQPRSCRRSATTWNPSRTSTSSPGCTAMRSAARTSPHCGSSASAC